MRNGWKVLFPSMNSVLINVKPFCNWRRVNGRILGNCKKGCNHMKIFSLCFTGVSGSGKSTLAILLNEALKNNSIKSQIIDGDELRAELGHLFGYTKQERIKNTYVARTLAKYLNKSGINTIISIVAPYEEQRDGLRKYLGEAYIEVYVKCSYDECARRDVKGYYQKQKQGMMDNLNGANDVFEIPKNSEIVVDTENNTADQCIETILTYLKEKGYVV